MTEDELTFFIDVVRNAIIIAGLMLVSVWATGKLSWELVKPAMVFFFGYIFTELANYYGLMGLIPNSKKGATLLYSR